MSQQPDSSGADDESERHPSQKSSRAFLLVGGVLVAVAVILVIALVVTRGPDTSSPEGIAEDTVTAFNDQDVDDLVALTCEEDRQEVESTVNQLVGYAPGGERIEVTAELRGVDVAGADTAVAELEITYANVPEEMRDVLREGSSVNRKLSLRQESGEWCVSWFE